MTSLNTHAQFDIQGHRGCRGLLPENTIAAFIKAVELGVTTLEMDVVITADNRVLVSHDPFMAYEICRTPQGNDISKKMEKSYNIYQMTASEAMAYDCGSKPYFRFKNQLNQVAFKPLLSDVIDAVEKYISDAHLPPVYYNIETKCTPEGDGIFNPSPEVFSDLVLSVINSRNIIERTYIQSFDNRILQYLKNKNEQVKLVLLVENLKGIDKNIANLGFQPDGYSPYFKLLNKNDVERLHSMKIKVIPWTVNSKKDMQDMIRIGVDGIITDFPDRLIRMLKGD